MKGITWSRDSHGLFDYESRHLTKRTMKAQSELKISRVQNDLENIPLTEEEEKKIVEGRSDLLKIVEVGSK